MTKGQEEHLSNEFIKKPTTILKELQEYLVISCMCQQPLIVFISLGCELGWRKPVESLEEGCSQETPIQCDRSESFLQRKLE